MFDQMCHSSLRAFSFIFLSSLFTERELGLVLLDGHCILYVFVIDLFLWRPCEKEGVEVYKGTAYSLS